MGKETRLLSPFLRQQKLKLFKNEQK